MKIDFGGGSSKAMLLSQNIVTVAIDSALDFFAYRGICISLFIKYIIVVSACQDSVRFPVFEKQLNTPRGQTKLCPLFVREKSKKSKML